MIARRDLIAGGLALAAAGTAEALRPRQRLVLLKGKVEQVLPTAFGNWTADTSSGLVTPELAGKLANSLYSEIVSRIYYEGRTGSAVMLLAAYGDTQSDLLQLHRPEVCYPAVGYTLRSTEPASVSIAQGAELPTRQVVAFTSDRVENILYWTRIGELLPQSAGEQRDARFQNAREGLVPDGILMRCSTLGDSAGSFAMMKAFVPDLMRAVPAAARPAFVGTRLAKRL